jgi:hypothetical protein
MKKLLILIPLLLCGMAFGQSAQRFTGALSAACSNSTTSCNATANSQLNVGIGEYALATVTVTGTFTGATIFFEFSDDGGNSWFQNTCTRSDIFLQEGTEALKDSTPVAWDCGVAASSFFRIRLSAIGTGAVNAAVTLSVAQIEPAATVALVAIDPCQSSAIPKQSAVINISSATTTSLVAISGTTTIYVCGFSVTLASTVAADTIQFEYGTGATCGTGTVLLTGALNTAGFLTGTISYGPGSTIFKTVAAQRLCAVTTVGTGPSIQGVMTFVQI